MKKIKITKEFIKANADKTLKEVFPEICAPVLEVGKWYKSEVGLFCVTEIREDYVYAYGFDRGEWKESGTFLITSAKGDVEATGEEIFNSLKNEAIKRGYQEGVFITNRIESCVLSNEYPKQKEWLLDCDFEFSHKGYLIMENNGKWATIIQTITKDEAEKLLNKKIV